MNRSAINYDSRAIGSAYKYIAGGELYLRLFTFAFLRRLTRSTKRIRTYTHSNTRTRSKSRWILWRALRSGAIVRFRSYRSTHLRWTTTTVAVAAEKSLASGNIIVASTMQPHTTRLEAVLPDLSITNPRPEYMYLAEKRLTGTCGMHCRVRATENVGQSVRRAVRSFVRSSGVALLIKRNELQ